MVQKKIIIILVIVMLLLCVSLSLSIFNKEISSSKNHPQYDDIEGSPQGSINLAIVSNPNADKVNK